MEQLSDHALYVKSEPSTAYMKNKQPSSNPNPMSRIPYPIHPQSPGILYIPQIGPKAYYYVQPPTSQKPSSQQGHSKGPILKWQERKVRSTLQSIVLWREPTLGHHELMVQATRGVFWKGRAAARGKKKKGGEKFFKGFCAGRGRAY